MIRLLMAIGFALVTTQASAQVAVPKSYVDGEVIHADELNTNLKAIADVVPPRDCTTDQIIKWDGSAWVCSSPERVTQTFVSDGGYTDCPSGKKVTGGGCAISAPNLCSYVYSYPRSDLSGWRCAVTGSSGCRVEQGYAICQ